MFRKKVSSLMGTLKRIVKSPGSKVGAVLIGIIVLACIFAPVIAPYDPNEMDFLAMSTGPSKAHLMGTDDMGRDILSRLLYGGRYSMALGFCASLFGCLVGIVIGSFAGYFGGKVEAIIMRVMDIWSSLPSLLLCILISAALGAGFFNTILALAVGGVPSHVRMIRGQILRERSKEYLEAAECINCSVFSIMFRHILPNVIAPLIVTMTMDIGSAVTMSASLSFIGLGVQPPTPEWGAILSSARSHILKSPYMIMFPGLIIAITVLAINLLGDGLRDALDPRLRD